MLNAASFLVMVSLRTPRAVEVLPVKMKGEMGGEMEIRIGLRQSNVMLG